MYQSPVATNFPTHSLTVEREASSTSLAPSSVSAGNGSTTRRRNRLKDYYGLQDAESGLGQLDLEDFSAPSALPSKTYSSSNLKSLGPNPMDMDSPFFVPETYISKCVNEYSLSEMIGQDNDLVAEIKELDAGMKTLVYGNYNKFIAASDTIRAMREKVDDMDIQMQLFSAKMDSISEKSHEVHAFLGEKRAKIRQLTGVHSLLNKLHFVFDLPAKLSVHLQKKDYKAAVLLHAETSSILYHYKSLSLFSKINSECSAIIDVLTRRVLSGLKNPTASPADISETVWMLGTLGRGFEGAFELADEYLNVMKAQMTRLMDKTASEMKNMTAPNRLADFQGKFLPEVELCMLQIKHWNVKVLKQVNDFQLKFHEFFLTGGHEDGEGSSGFIGASNLTLDQRIRLEKELEILSESFVERYFSEASSLIAIPDDVWSYSALPFISIFDIITRDVASHRGLTLFLNMEERVRVHAVGHVKSVSNTAFGAVKKAFMEELSKIEHPNTSSKVVLEEANSVLQDGIISRVFPLLEKFVDERLGFVSGERSDGGKEAVLEMVTGCFESFWTTLKLEAQDFSGQAYTPDPTYPPTLLLLLLSRASLCHSETIVPSLYSTFTTTVLRSRNTPVDSTAVSQAAAAAAVAKRNTMLIVTAGGGTIASAHSSGSYSRRAGSNAPSGVEKEISAEISPRNLEVLKHGKFIAREWKSVAKGLAFRFVSVASSGLCSTVRKYVKETSWISIGEPITASTAWKDEVLGKLSGIDEQLRLVYDEEFREGLKKHQLPSLSINNGSAMGGTPQRIASTKFAKSSSSMFAPTPSNGRLSKRPSVSAIGVGTGGGKFDNMLGNIDLMFQEKSEFFGNVEMTREGIISAILRIVVKVSFIIFWLTLELRLQIVGPSGLHHVQVDSAVLRRFLADGNFGNLSDDGLLNSLADEMVTSGMKRCVDPILLGYEEIGRISCEMIGSE
ncbi:hypothetical protein BC830DRAFT_1080571 [Chytriomyces sp. MP71]|nr:hypothetical protein BC830DRAFT_1080571 [Chytriomyces sp. MP71]